jgi:hypothetical protein
MRSDVRVDHRVRAPAKDALYGLWVAPIAWLMALSVAAAQTPAGSSSSTTLPEIRVIATTPVAPTRTPPPAPAAAARAAPTAAPPTTAAAAPETAAKAVPGAVELDKIPSNVVSVGAPAFDGTKASRC